MNFKESDINIDRICKALEEKDRDYLLFLKTKFYLYDMMYSFKKLRGIQPKKAKIMKKGFKAIMEIWQRRGAYVPDRIILWTRNFEIIFIYLVDGKLWNIEYKHHTRDIDFKTFKL